MSLFFSLSEISFPQVDAVFEVPHAYPDLPISQCPDQVEYFADLLGRTIVIHPFNQSRTRYLWAMMVRTLTLTVPQPLKGS
jgi:hypothetical protein